MRSAFREIVMRIAQYKSVPIILGIAGLYLVMALLAMSDAWPAHGADIPAQYQPRLSIEIVVKPYFDEKTIAAGVDLVWPSMEKGNTALQGEKAEAARPSASPDGAEPLVVGVDLARTAPPSEALLAAHPRNRTIRIAAVGDIMMGKEGTLPSDGGAGIFSDAKDHFAGCDVVFGNLEGPLTDRGVPTKTFTPGRSYLFRTPPEYAAHLKNAGFTMLSLANNHINDYGWDGHAHTMKLLNELGIGHTGAIGQIAVQNVNGTRIAVIGLAPNAGCQNINDIPAAVALVKKAVQVPGTLVVVSFHGGAEGEAGMDSVDEVSTYLGEKRGDLRRLSHAVIDAGADLVLGHGPHVPRGLEVYKSRLIAYSLGNFATCAGISVQGTSGLAPLLLADLHPSGELADMKIVSFRQRYNQGPRLDPYDEAALSMLALSKEILAPEWAARLLLPGSRSPEMASADTN